MEVTIIIILDRMGSLALTLSTVGTTPVVRYILMSRWSLS